MVTCELLFLHMPVMSQVAHAEASHSVCMAVHAFLDMPAPSCQSHSRAAIFLERMHIAVARQHLGSIIMS